MTRNEDNIIVTGEIVPVELMPKFDALIKETNSRYNNNPSINHNGDYYRVNYTTPDSSLSHQWHPILNEYNEKNKPLSTMEKFKTTLAKIFKKSN